MSLSRKEIVAVLLAAYGDLALALADDTDEGICHNCGHIQSGVEPDARNCICEECKQDTVFGVEETIMTIL